MDDRGRFAQPLIWLRDSLRPLLAAGIQALVSRRTVIKSETKATRQAARRSREARGAASRIGRLARRLRPLAELQFPRGSGIAATFVLIFGFTAYGITKGGHVPTIVAQLKDARDAVANAAGFRIASIALGGHKNVSREEILGIAGVTGRTSLLFLDADTARASLKTNPWIADATVLKLYPDRLHIAVTERDAFALWQKDGRVTVIAADGTIVQPYVAPRFARLPLVVGQGAEKQASEFLSVLNRYPDIREQVRAAVLVAERRWNLRLKNGMDIRLPEAGAAQALEALLALDRDKAILSRDITAIDLRLPDRVTVRLSESAAKAREESVKTLKAKKKGTDA
jgi:cell division protein FtsQ